MRDYYQILDLTPDASPQEVKDRYRQLVRFFHPDRFPKDEDKAYAEQRLKEINEAYEALHGATSRGLRLDVDPRPPQPAATPQMVDFGAVVHGRSALAKLEIDNLGGMAQSLNFHHRNKDDWFQIVRGESLHASDPLPMLLTLEAKTADLDAGSSYDSWLDIDMNGVRRRVTLTMQVVEPASPDRRLGWLLIAIVSALLVVVLVQARQWIDTESISAVDGPLLASRNGSADIGQSPAPIMESKEPAQAMEADKREAATVQVAAVVPEGAGQDRSYGRPSALVAVSAPTDINSKHEPTTGAAAIGPTAPATIESPTATLSPTETPTETPTEMPTQTPTETPTETATPQPSPTSLPTPSPVSLPTASPTQSAAPTVAAAVEAIVAPAIPAIASSIFVTVPQTFQINARAATSIESTSLALLPKGAAYPAIARTIDNAWTQIVLPDGRLAWVFTSSMTADMTLIETLPLPPELLNAAAADSQ